MNVSSSNSPNGGGSIAKRLGLGTAVVGAIVAVVISWTGIGDLRPFCGVSHTCAATPSKAPTARPLSPGSPLTVVWPGTGDQVVAHWAPVNDPDLDHYQVNIVALYPESFTIDAGYRDGEQLETSRTVNPASDSIQRYKSNDDPLTLSKDQTWQLCAVGYRSVPMGADAAKYEIQGSGQCSDPFSIPGSRY